MTIFDSISADNLHHAYFVVGGEDTKTEIFDFVENKIGVQTIGNPDFSFFALDTLTVDHARDISEMQSRKSVSRSDLDTDSKVSKVAFDKGRKIFVIQTNIITEEAQNALLKIFEEPTPDTHFFILMPQDILLPTFRSRMQVVDVSKVAFDMNSKVSRTVLDTGIAGRLAIVNGLIS